MNFKEYKNKCEERWHGPALLDALHNWAHFEDIRVDLIAALKQFHGNRMLEDMNGRCHNPDGTLTAFLWKLQDAWQPDRNRLDPLLDFEEHYQKIFLRRGLVIYCADILDNLNERDNKNPDQLLIFDPGYLDKVRITNIS